MRHHPLTPMTDANLVRVLQAQLTAQRGRPDRPAHGRRRRGRGQRRASPRSQATACRFAIVDAVGDADLHVLAQACRGIAAGRRRLRAGHRHPGAARPAPECRRRRAAGRARQPRAMSAAAARPRRNAQVAAFIAAGGAALAIDPLRLAGGTDLAAEALAWADAAPRRTAGAGLRHRRTGSGARSAGAARRRTRRRAGRGHAGAHRRGPGAARRRPAARRRRRDLGRLRAGAGHPAAAHRAADRPRRAVVPCRSGARAAPGAEVRQLRRHRLLQPRLRRCCERRRAALRDEICRVGRSLYDRGYVHASAGNISVRLADGFLITPTDACLGTLRPDALAQRRRAGPPDAAATRASKTLALHRRIYAADAGRALRDPHAQHAPGRADACKASWSQDDIVPPITPYFVMKVGHVPLIRTTARRRRPPPRWSRERIEAMAARGTPIRAVMLERLGPERLARIAGRSQRGARRAGGNRQAVADGSRSRSRCPTRRSKRCASVSARAGKAAAAPQGAKSSTWITRSAACR